MDRADHPRACGNSRRFSELLETVPGISSRVLSQRLAELEKAGLVTRKVYPEAPVRVEYSLTAVGRALAPTMAGFAKWAYRWEQARSK
jgi:DNA-binding HxlR family transcriptional regulator